VVGFDPRGGRIFAQNHSTPLLIYSSTGIKQKEVNTNGRDRLEPEQFLAHPDGGKLLIRTNNAVVYVDLTGAAPPKAEGPAADTPAKVGAAVRPLFFDTGAYMNRVALSPDGHVVVTALGNQVRRWEANTGRPLGSPVVHTQEVHGVAFSPDGRLLATGCNDGKARLWDADTGTLRKEFPAQGGHVGRVAFSPDGTVLAAHADQAFKLWEVESGKERAACAGSKGAGPIFGIANVSFSKDGKLIAAGDQAGTVKVWDAATGALKHTLSGHKREALTVAFSPDGKWLASGSLDQTVKLWDAATFEEVATIPAHRQMIRSVAFSPDSKLLATASQDGSLKLWDVAGRKEALALPRGGANYRDPVMAEFSRDGTTLVSAWMDQHVRLWDVKKLLASPGNP
jgi:WD40 repeat protein